MKKSITSPCHDCGKIKRFFCITSCIEHDQWRMDQFIMPLFKAPKPVERFTDLDSKDELIDALQEKIAAQEECLRSRDVVINALQEDLNLFKAAEQFGREEHARLQATLMDRDREIARQGTAIFQLQPFKDNYEEMGIGTVHVEICDYCKEKHDPRVACSVYAATLKGIEKVPPGEPDPRD